MNLDYAIQHGIDSARAYRKDGMSPYHQMDPRFRYWWEAVVLKSDLPDLSDREIGKRVREKYRQRSR